MKKETPKYTYKFNKLDVRKNEPERLWLPKTKARRIKPFISGLNKERWQLQELKSKNPIP